MTKDTKKHEVKKRKYLKANRKILKHRPGSRKSRSTGLRDTVHGTPFVLR
jgi:hypothetical protein